jgi:predicted Zn-dependent protease with MMP-like domain
MQREDFEKLVALGFEMIPEKFRAKIKNVAILIEDAPSEELRRHRKLSTNVTLLCLYQGIPRTARGDSYGVGPTMPDTITIFQKPIEESGGGDPDHIKRLVSEVIWHEYAHHFGLNEREVRKKEKIRGKYNNVGRKNNTI